MIHDLYPKASPKITFVAAPVRHESATSWTGLYALLVKYSVTNPIISPAHKPTLTHKNNCLQNPERHEILYPICETKFENYQLRTSFWIPKLKMVKEGGRATQLTSAIPIVIKMVEIMSWYFKAGSISLTVLISKKSVAKRVVSKQTRIPMELTRRGYIIEVKS